MRNKAAEKAKTSCAGGSSGPSVGGGQNSPTSQASATGGNGGGVGSPGSMAGQAASALQMGIHGSDISALQRPSYSINGILGIPQPDANANINKRKRDDSEDNRELNGHPDDPEVVKRQRNHAVYANELYNTMWNAPNQQPQQPQQQNNHEKWGPQPVKEEPKNNIPLPEILENSSASPHVMVCFLNTQSL